MNEWLHTLFGSPREPGIWIAASLSIAIVASNLTWLFTRRVAGAARGRLPITPAVAWLVVSTFLLTLPFLGLGAGALSTRAMGLTSLDWLHDLGLGGLMAAMVTALSLWGWSRYRQQPVELAWPTSVRWLAPVNAILKQWHWAFYRAAAAGVLAGATLAADPLTLAPATFGAPEAGTLGLPWLQITPLLRQAVHVLGGLDSAMLLYWGSWVGLGLAGVEAVLNPFTRAAMQRPGGPEAVVVNVVLAIATTALFVVVRNFWICAACHIIVETAIKWPQPIVSEPATS